MNRYVTHTHTHTNIYNIYTHGIPKVSDNPTTRHGKQSWLHPAMAKEFAKWLNLKMALIEHKKGKLPKSTTELKKSQKELSEMNLKVSQASSTLIVAKKAKRKKQKRLTPRKSSTDVTKKRRYNEVPLMAPQVSKIPSTLISSSSSASSPHAKTKQRKPKPSDLTAKNHASSSTSTKIFEYAAGVNELGLKWIDAGKLVDTKTNKLLEDWDVPNVCTSPVYLGFIKCLTNTKRAWSRNQIRQFIQSNKRETGPGGRLHHLESYFTTGGKCKVHYHIDHIIPLACGGCDHPRNYALMPTKWNQYFGQWHTMEKQRYLGLTVARRVREFVRWLRKNQTINWENLDKW